VQAAESAALAALRTQEETLLRLAAQLREAAHTEISTLQATEGRLLEVVQHSTQRLRLMQAQRQKHHAQISDLLQKPGRLLQLVLSGGYVMYAGGAMATAAAVFAASRLGHSSSSSSRSVSAAGADSVTANMHSGGGGVGGANGRGPSSVAPGAGGSAGGQGGFNAPAGRMPGRGPVVAAAAVHGSLAAPPRTAHQEDDLALAADAYSSSSSSTRNASSSSSKWRSLMSSVDTKVPTALPQASELPAHLSQLLASDSTGVMGHLQHKAVEAAAATQVLHMLQQQDADVAVKSAELAASSLAAEKKLAEAVRCEAQAAGQLLQLEQAAKAPAGSISISRNSSSRSQALKLAGKAMQQQLSAARRQLEETTTARAAAQAEVEDLKAALLQEQSQVGTNHTSRQHSAHLLGGNQTCSFYNTPQSPMPFDDHSKGRNRTRPCRHRRLDRNSMFVIEFKLYSMQHTVCLEGKARMTCLECC